RTSTRSTTSSLRSCAGARMRGTGASRSRSSCLSRSLSLRSRAAAAANPRRRPYSEPVVLSDREIRAAIAEGRIDIDPFDERCVQPASVDIRLDHRFRVFRSSRHAFIDLARPLDDVTELVEIPTRTPFILHPGEFVLGSTRERLRLPDDIVSRVEGKSSLGRLGLLIHSTAGFIDPAWDGHITLELSNVNTIPITLYAGMRI